MFTGIIEEIGRINAIRHGAHSAVLIINASDIMGDVHIGDSIAVNGVCLTVTAFTKEGFCADVMHETLKRSSLAALKSGSVVNLERAMAVGGRFGGHIVAGHVDGVGTICEVTKDDNAVWYRIKAEDKVLRYIVEKGSVAIDGISLTVAKVTASDFSVSIIPHTAGQTILSAKKAGDIVNIENDVIGKYVEKLLMPYEPDKTEAKDKGITMEFLYKNGF